MQTFARKPVPPALVATNMRTAARAPGPLLSRRCNACEEEATLQRRTAESGLQRLAINEPGDVFEREADRVADQVMRMTDTEETRPAPVRLQRRTSGRMSAGEAPDVVHEVLSSPGVPLDGGTRGFMESRFGHDFSRVRVHTDGKAAESANAVDALAYTVGQDIVFGRGRYAPGSAEGRHLLAHELTHTIQQGAIVQQARIGAQPVQRRATAFAEQHSDAMGVAEQLGVAMAGWGTDEEAIYAALDGRSRGEIESIKVAYKALTNRNLLAHLSDELSGNELERALGAMGIAPSVYDQNTELGGLSVGNFDFHFKNCEIVVWVWVKFQFTSDITPAEQGTFKARFINVVHKGWANTGYSLSGGGSCPCADVPIRVHVQESPGYYHKLVDVERKSDFDRRPKVIGDINVNLSTDDDTFIHEFGHVLGLYDEYDGGFFENIMFWHKNVASDHRSLMSGGNEMRPRYFEHYRKRVQETAPHGCQYTCSAVSLGGSGK